MYTACARCKTLGQCERRWVMDVEADRLRLVAKVLCPTCSKLFIKVSRETRREWKAADRRNRRYRASHPDRPVSPGPQGKKATVKKPSKIAVAKSPIIKPGDKEWENDWRAS